MYQLWRICSLCLLLLFLSSRTVLRQTIDVQHTFCDWLNGRMNEWWILSERVYMICLYLVYIDHLYIFYEKRV